MAWYHKFPWTNFHELNLDWIIDICGKAEKVLPDAAAATEAANEAARLANNNAVAASDAATRANRAAQNIDPVTATASVGSSAEVQVVETSPGIRFDFTIPQGKQGEPGKASAGSLCDNGYFLHPVNQRGKNSYDGSGSKTYTIDRWYTTDNGSGIVTVSDNGITVKAGCHIVQEIPEEALQVYPSEIGMDYTAVARDVNGNVHINDSSVNISIADVTGVLTITLGSGRWEYVALYKGEYNTSNIPGFVPKGYQTEFINCQRYFIGGVGRFTPVSINEAGNARMCYAAPVPMRIAPTAVLITGDNVIFNVAGTNKVLAVTGVTVESTDNNFIYINISCAADASMLYAAGSTYLTRFDLSADM